MNAITITTLHFLTFLGIGLFFAILLVRRKFIPSQYTLILAYAISCFLGYILFFVYAFNTWYGTVSTEVFYLTGVGSLIGLIFWAGRDQDVWTILKKNVLPPLSLILLVVAAYTSITFTCHDSGVPQNEAYAVSHACILHNTTGDNILPQFFSDKLIENKDRELADGWKLADRPPLQIGAVVSLMDVIPNDATKLFAYQVFATFLQLAWIAGLWALLKSIKLRRDQEFFVLVGSIFLGFYYYNSVYVWPKLLAASFVMAAISLLVYNKERKSSKNIYYNYTFAVILSTLGLLAHGSVLFTLITLAIFLLISRKLPSMKVLLVAFAIGLIIYTPWLLYKERTTTSDRLVKWHFAGIIEVNDKSTAETLIDTYKHTSLPELASSKAKNFEALFYKQNLSYRNNKEPQTTIDHQREREFFVTFAAFSLLNLGWIGILFTRKKDSVLYRKIKPLAILGLGSLVVWCLLMFIPGSTIIHQNSYATMMILITVLILSLASFGTKLRTLIISLNVLLFFVMWVFSSSYENRNSLITASILTLAAISSTIALLLKIYFGKAYRIKLTK